MSKNSQVILQQIIEAQKEELDIDGDLNQFFGNFAAIQLLKNYELSYEEIEKGNVDRSLDGGIDNFYLFINGDLIDWTCFVIDDEDNLSEGNYLTEEFIVDKYKKNIEIEVVLIQSKFENSFNETAITKLKTSLENLLDWDKDIDSFKTRYNSSVRDAFSVLRAIYLVLIPKRCKLAFNIYYASKGKDIHPNVQTQAEELKSLVIRNLTNTVCEFKFIGAQDLVDFYQKIQDTNFKISLSENAISDTAGSYIGIVSIRELFNFITDDGHNLIKHIFESNVRDYQGKNNVNSEIADTLKNNTTEDFWWLNNGITILSTGVTQTTNKHLVIQNPEIVNGLQTSSEIYRYFRENDHLLAEGVVETRNVLIRVIIPASEEARDKIIKATNSQTQIPKSSLRATDPIHRQIEMFLKTKGYFYDRRKNFYKNEGKKPREIVSLQFMSQCLISVLMQKPDDARARPSSLLDDENSYSRLFSNSIPLEVFYLLSYFGKQIEDLCRNIDGLETNQSSDIKFHLLYAVVALATKKHKPNTRDVESLKEDSLGIYLEKAQEITKELYLAHGANNKAAKSPKLREDLILRIQEMIQEEQEEQEEDN